MIKVKLFAQIDPDISSDTHYWYQNDSGDKVDCTEDVVDKLWWIYIVSPGCYRADADGYNIFGFKEPYMINS